jgi:prophage regulatory protein
MHCIRTDSRWRAWHEATDATAREDGCKPARDPLIKPPEVCRQAGFGKSAIYEMITAGTFPEPIKLGCASRCSQLEIQDWITQQKAARKAT